MRFEFLHENSVSWIFRDMLVYYRKKIKVFECFDIFDVNMPLNDLAAGIVEVAKRRGRPPRLKLTEYDSSRPRERMGLRH